MALLSRPKISTGDRRHVNDVLAYAFNGAVRIDWNRLGEGDQCQLVELVKDATREDGFAPSRLSRGDRMRLESLVERGTGLEDGYFERARVEDRERRETAERDTARRRRPFSRGEVTNVFRALHDEVDARNLLVDDVATICTVLALFAAAEPFAGTESTVRFEEGDGEVELQFNILYGLAPGGDDGGLLDGLTGRAKYLASQGWFKLRNSGPLWGLRLGPRLLDAIERGPVDDEEEVTP